MKILTFLSMILTSLIGGAVFYIKYTVVHIEKEINDVENKIAQTQETLHVLKAEWSYLNDPRRIQELAAQYLGIHPPDASQLTTIKVIAHHKKIRP